MTKFAFEVPIRHLADFDEDQDFFFGLSFLLGYSLDYKRYLMWKIMDGRGVIIDNGFNETQEPAKPSDMAVLWWDHRPDAIIAPDADNWSAYQLLEAYRETRKRVRVDPNPVMGLFRNRTEYYDLQLSGCRQFGISYWYYTDTNYWNRWTADVQLANHHWLGLGDLSIMQAHKPKSLDTALPIKWAIKGQTFADWVNEGGLHNRGTANPYDLRSENRLRRAMDYFDTTLTPAQIDLAKANIRALKEAVNESRIPGEGVRHIGGVAGSSD